MFNILKLADLDSKQTFTIRRPSQLADLHNSAYKTNANLPQNQQFVSRLVVSTSPLLVKLFWSINLPLLHM